MKKGLFFLCLFFLSLVCPSAGAKQVSPYSLDFDTPLETADHSFAPVGWGHIVDNFQKYGSTEWVEYKWNSTSGIDDSGALFIGTQDLEIDDDDDETYYKTCKDMLVTPALTGTSSIWVKKGKSGSSSISFYLVTEENGKLTAGDKITVTVPTLNNSKYVQVSIPQQADGSRIGIVGSNVYVDNFSAASADIDFKTEIKVASVKSNMPKYHDADENGLFNVSFKVNVRNTGNVDITKGTENFSVSLVNSTLNDSVMATVDIPQDLEAGELSDTIVVSAVVDANAFPGEYAYKVRENLGGSTVDGLKFQITPHKPTIGLFNAAGKNEYADGDTLYYGISKKAATGTFVLKNDGGDSLQVTAVEAPEGYLVNKGGAFTVAPHDTALVVMTMTADAAGPKNGNLVIRSNIGDKTFRVEGETADTDLLFVDFEDGIPADFYNIGNWSTDSDPADIGMIGNSKAAYGFYYSGDAKRLVSPLVEVKEGEKLRFIAARKDSKCSLDVLYSTDRKNWTLVRTLSSEAENEADKLSGEIVVKGSYSNKYAYKEYTIDNIPAGQCYLAFDNKSVYVDNIYGFHKVAVKHDIIFTAATMKAVGTVNSALTAHAKLVSMRDEAEEADGYTLGLYVDGQLAAKATPVKLAQGKETEFSVSFTPHKAGQHEVAFRFASDDYTALSDVMPLTVGEETSASEKAVGNPSGFSYTDGPLYTYENASQTELLYKPQDISLPAGSKISKIAFRGYISYGTLDAHVRAYMESSDLTKFETSDIDADSTKMDKIFDGTVHFEEGGSAAEPVNQFELTFNEPLVYDGKGIHLLLVHEAKTYKSVYFQVDGSITDQSKHSYKEWGSEKNSFSKLPVAYFSVAVEPHTLSGLVTDKATSKPLDSVVVTLHDNGVEYTDTTDAEGHYSMTVYKFDRQYSVSARKLGYYLEPMDSTEVSDLNSTLDIAMTEAKHLMVANAIAPKEAMVNYAYQTAVDVYNYTAADKKAADYTLSLSVNGEETDTVASVDIAAGEKATLLLGYTPHQAGTDKLVAKITTDGETYATEEYEVAVAEEKALTEKQVGDALSEAKDAPVNAYWKHSEAQTIYPAKMLKLKKGMKIVRVAYKGWSPGNVYQKAKIWMENTSDLNNDGMMTGDTTQMKVVFDGIINLPEGTQVGSPTDPAEVFAFDIPDGFVYNGGNLRVAGRGDVLNNSSAAINFVSDNNVNNTTYKRASDSSVEGKSWDKAYNTPVAYLTVEFKYQIAGTVKAQKDDTPVANATVTMESDDVIYATTTDADGHYSMDILQPALTYTLTVKAELFKDYKKEGLKYADDDMTEDVALETDPTTTIQRMATAEGELSVYTLDGQLVAKGRSVMDKLPAGTYIVKDHATNKTKKLIKK